MDAPVHGKRVGLHVARQRYRCGKCGKIALQPLVLVDEKHKATTRLIDFIKDESLKRTFTSVARDVGLSEGTVRSIFKARIAALEKTYDPITPAWLGIDEVNILRPRCVLSNVGERTIIDLLETRTKVAVVNRLSRLSNKQRVEVVAIDMWRPYADAARAVLPQAAVIIDKFHVVRLASLALDTVRKSIRTTLSEHHRLKLKGDRFLLLRRAHDLNDFDRLKLETWTNAYPELGAAYVLKERFYEVYDAADRLEAEAKYEAWRASVPSGLQGAYKPLLTATKNWHPEIFNYFDHAHVTNAFTESLNGLIRLINRNGRGYSFDAIRAKILYTKGVRVAPKPLYERSLGNLERMMTDGLSQPLYSLLPTPTRDYGASLSTLTDVFERETETT